MKLVTLPGFLGVSQDFDSILISRFFRFPLEKKSLCLSQSERLQTWSEWREEQARTLREWKSKSTLVGLGYSLGGRLLLSLACQDLSLFDALIFISTNPGLSSIEQKNERKASDEVWAQKFESRPWEPLMREWNSQSVFQGSHSEPGRVEENYSREQLAWILREYSLANQSVDLAALQNIPQLWVAGEKDQKFVELLSRVPDAKGTRKWICPQSSHRVLFDQPQALTKSVAEFLEGLSSNSKN